MKNLINKRFGRLLVLSKSEIRTKDNRTQWNCVCSCGNKVLAENRTLTSGKKKSCGCLKLDSSLKNIKGVSNKTHNMSRTRIYKIWNALVQRCKTKSNQRYSSYGGRGITVCQEWYKFENFYRDMKNSYKDNLTIDRIDNNKGYSKENCRWATNKQQSRNKRDNFYVTYNKETKSLVEWCEELNLNYGTIHARLKVYKWSVEKAFTEPYRWQKPHAII